LGRPAEKSSTKEHPQSKKDIALNGKKNNLLGTPENDQRGSRNRGGGIGGGDFSSDQWVHPL